MKSFKEYGLDEEGRFLEEDKFSFQRAISKFVLEHDIPLDLLLNPLSASAALT